MSASILTSVIVSVLMLTGCLTTPVMARNNKNRRSDIDPSLGRFTTIKPYLLTQAMRGIDPFIFHEHDSSNSGLKDQIFIPASPVVSLPGTLKLHDFVGRAGQDLQCDHLHSPLMRTLHNYNSYQNAMSESVSFKSEDDLIVGLQKLRLPLSGHLTATGNEEESLVNFFRQGGEIVLGNVPCQTHSVSINLHTKPNFTENFISAVRKVISAAREQDEKISLKTMSNFFDNFGTHFQDKTLFGSNLTIIKLFARKAANISEKVERLRCVSSSFTQNLHSNSTFDEIVRYFSRDVERCEEGTKEVLDSLGLFSYRIITTGIVPVSGLENTIAWPVPIYRRLQNLTVLFEEGWLDYLQASMNTTFEQGFFEKMSTEHKNKSSHLSFGAVEKVGCGYNSDCNFHEKCIDDLSAGGYRCGRYCNIKDICPDGKVCVEDNSLLGYSCLSGCGYTSDCSDAAVCENDDSLLGYRCLEGCDNPKRCPDNTACVEDDSAHGFSCQRGCNFTDNCTLQELCLDDSSEAGFTCQKPCEVPGSCAPDEACYPEEHSLRGYICVPNKPGRAVIIGGYGKEGPLKSVEHVNFWNVPDLPVTIFQAAAATARDSIYLCGGLHDSMDSSACFRIGKDTFQYNWNYVPPAPLIMTGHSAVSIGEFVWFIYRSHLVELNARTHRFSTVTLPFDANFRHCSVSNGTHAYVVGAGRMEKEIWVNAKANNGSEWHFVRLMKTSRNNHACLWYGSNIMITGGSTNRNDVEIFNTETRAIWEVDSLLTGRDGHAMMLLDGKPTVLGGESELGPIPVESFSLESNSWIEQRNSVTDSNRFFSLVQIYNKF